MSRKFLEDCKNLLVDVSEFIAMLMGFVDYHNETQMSS